MTNLLPHFHFIQRFWYCYKNCSLIAWCLMISLSLNNHCLASWHQISMAYPHPFTLTFSHFCVLYGTVFKHWTPLCDLVLLETNGQMVNGRMTRYKGIITVYSLIGWLVGSLNAPRSKVSLKSDCFKAFTKQFHTHSYTDKCFNEP